MFDDDPGWDMAREMFPDDVAAIDSAATRGVRLCDALAILTMQRATTGSQCSMEARDMMAESIAVTLDLESRVLALEAGRVAQAQSSGLN